MDRQKAKNGVGRSTYTAMKMLLNILGTVTNKNRYCLISPLKEKLFTTNGRVVKVIMSWYLKYFKEICN